MSDEDKPFLARWSQRKREANQLAPAQAEPTNDAEPVTDDAGRAVGEPAEREGEAFDLASLPKLEDLTADSDMTVFFRKGVPEGLRNAALRKSWALDPAIRNYVNPALDYAYDWNAPGGVPGGGELAAGTDIAKLVSQIIGSSEATPKPASVLDDEAPADPLRTDDVAALPSAVPPAPAVRLSDSATPRHAEAANRSDIGKPDESKQEGHSSSVPQQEVRRHGAAKPRL